MTRELGPLEPMLKRFPKVHRLNIRGQDVFGRREKRKTMNKEKINFQITIEETSSKTS